MLQTSTTPTRLVIYTVLTGSKEPIGDPLAIIPPDQKHSDLEISFVCFTDNPSLTSPVWQFRLINDSPLPPEKLSRRPKALPHMYLQEWEYSLYIDNIIQLKRLPTSADLQTSKPYLFRVFRHSGRTNTHQEAEAIIQFGYEKASRICEQLEFYNKSIPATSITPLSTCTVILRQHLHPKVIECNTVWWEQILLFGKRDQMSFDFANHWTKTAIDHFPDFKHDNSLVYPAHNISQNRILANFDPIRYAWLNREDPLAIQNPRLHYLTNRPAPQETYATPPDILEFIAWHFKSSIGSFTSPRRNLCPFLQPLLRPITDKPCAALFVHISDVPEETSFSESELLQTERTLISAIRATTPVRVVSSLSELASGKFQFQPANGTFDFVFVLGLPGQLISNACNLIANALSPTNGTLCLLASSPFPIPYVSKIEQTLTSFTSTAIKTSIAPSSHDSSLTPIPNTALVFQWGTA